jgi:hypothetical protein
MSYLTALKIIGDVYFTTNMTYLLLRLGYGAHGNGTKKFASKNLAVSETRGG